MSSFPVVLLALDRFGNYLPTPSDVGTSVMATGVLEHIPFTVFWESSDLPILAAATQTSLSLGNHASSTRSGSEGSPSTAASGTPTSLASAGAETSGGNGATNNKTLHIVLGVVGGIILAGVMAGIVWFLIRRHRRQRQAGNGGVGEKESGPVLYVAEMPASSQAPLAELPSHVQPHLIAHAQLQPVLCAQPHLVSSTQPHLAEMDG